MEGGIESGGFNPAAFYSSHLPLESTFDFSVSFICLMVGSRLASPVVCVVVAGGPLLGIEVWPDGVFAGRVAVASGAALVWAFAACMSKSRTPDSKVAASVPNFIIVIFIDLFIDLAPVRSMKTATAL